MQQGRPLAGMSDPEVIIFGFSWAPRVLFWLFLLSAFAQIDVIVVPMLIRSGAIHPFAIGSWSHVFGAAIEIVIVVGAGLRRSGVLSLPRRWISQR